LGDISKNLGSSFVISYANTVQNSLDSVALIENIHMCKISTRIQDALADAPSIPYREMEYLDTQLVNWYERIPAMLKPDESFNDSIFLAGTTLRWRFQNQRMLLYRPALLSYAMSRIPYTTAWPGCGLVHLPGSTDSPTGALHC
jgi:hypothetical protein